MDAILYWNDVALEANRVSHTNGNGEQTGPPLSSRALAMVHLAMYDAYAGALGNPGQLPPYLELPSAPAKVSPDAAVAGAAHAMLAALFPSQKRFFEAKHAQAGLSGTASGLNDGNAFGVMVAQRLLEERRNDPGVGDSGYAPSMAQGAHRVDPEHPQQGFHAPFYGARARCFAVTKRHELERPPTPGSRQYSAAFRQVRSKGIAPELFGTLPSARDRRTADETLAGLFWGYDGASGLGTPPRLYNQILRQVAVAQGNDVAENARLFALVNAAMADAGVLAWEQKYVHDLWRPVLGIREHDASMGPAGTAGNAVSNDSDPMWLPFGAPRTNSTGKNFTPPFPAYPSGHATFGAAAFHMTRLFYKVTKPGPDSLCNGLSFVSEELNGVSTDNRGTVRPRHARTFPNGLWEMIRENSISRVYLGVHWNFDGYVETPNGDMDVSRNVGGVPLGIRIAEDIFNGSREKGLSKSVV